MAHKVTFTVNDDFIVDLKKARPDVFKSGRLTFRESAARRMLDNARPRGQHCETISPCGWDAIICEFKRGNKAGLKNNDGERIAVSEEVRLIKENGKYAYSVEIGSSVVKGGLFGVVPTPDMETLDMTKPHVSVKIQLEDLVKWVKDNPPLFP